MVKEIDVDEQVFELLERAARPFVETSPNAVLRRLLGIDKAENDDLDVRTPGRRLRKGLLLPEEEYQIPLLRTLIDLNGGAPMSEVLQALEPRLKDRFTQYDLATMKNGRTIRWHNRAQFVRLELVKQGDMSATSPRGIWQITEQGRQRVLTANAA